MGTAASRLEAPLVPQESPLRATHSSVVRQTPVSLRVDLTAKATTFRIVDARSGAVFHELAPHKESEKRTVRSDMNVPIATLAPTSENKKFYAVYDGSDTSMEPAFYIRIHEATGYPPVVSAEFKDAETGERCRLFVEGEPDDRVMLVYLERGTTFGPFEDLKHSNVEVVGRLRRPKTKGGVLSDAPDQVFMDAAAGVDLSLLTMLWCVRHELFSESGAFAHYSRREFSHDKMAKRQNPMAVYLDAKLS